MSSSTLPKLISPVPRTAELATLLSLIRDPKFQGDVADYLNNIETARKKYNETIERYGKAVAEYGKAVEIGSLLAKTKVASEKAENIILTAQIQADTIISEAASQKEADQAANKVEQDKLANKRKLLTSDAGRIREEEMNRDTVYAGHMAALEKREDAAEHKALLASKLETKYKEAIKRLKDAGVKV